MIHGAAAITLVPEPKTFDKGLIFVKDTDILLSGDRWTIVINIAMDDYTTLVDNMKLILKQMRQKIQVQKTPKPYSFDIHWNEISRLETMIRELEVDVESFQKLLLEETPTRNIGTSSVRAKRGLIDVLGYGLKYLFGTVDARDVKRLTAICDELHVFETRIKHAVDNQLTYIRTLDDTTRQNAEDIAKLAKTLRSSMEGLSTQYNRV